MMLRKLAVSLAVAGIISASNANALGLGEIKIHSALNEPLNAEIKLLQVRKLGPLQIQPRMANIDEFALAGLDKSSFLTDVSFQVKVNPDGSGLITLRSDRAVKEPFLNFLVELNWPNGRLVREYTLLLDPPVFDPTPVRKTVQPPASAVTVKSPVDQISSNRISLPQSSTSVNRTTNEGQVYVKTNDTLWSIALKHRPTRKVSARQMMIALQKKNPHAFVNNNINFLKAGAVLTLPTPEEINQLNFKDAAKEVGRQTTEWKKEPATSASVSEESVKKNETKEDAVASEVSEGPVPEPEEVAAELKIVTPKDSIEPEEGVMTDQSEEEVGEEAEVSVDELDEEKNALAERNLELEARLSESLESVDKIARENVELNERLDSFQYELEKLREMLELKDNQLSALQNQVKAAEAAPKPKPEKGILDALLGSPLTLGGIGAALIALLGGLFFFMRRKGEDEEKAADDAALVQVPDELAVEPEVTAEAAEESSAELKDETVEDELDIGAEDDLLESSDLAETDELDELDDLDLDMDLDLEEDAVADDLLETVDSIEEPDELDKLLEDDEFDLGLDDDDEIEPEPEESADTELDSILAMDDDSASDDKHEGNDALDDILGEVDSETEAENSDEEIDLGLDEDLEFEVEDTVDESVSEEALDSAEDDDEGLDFIVSPSDEAVADTSDISEASDSEDIDEDGLDELLDSVSDDEIVELSEAAENAGDIEDLDLILNEQAADESEETEEVDELDSILGELDDVEAELEAESDVEPDEQLSAEDVTDADLEEMLAANSNPDSLDSASASDGDDLDELLASMDEPSDEADSSDDASDDLDAMLDDINLEDIDLGESEEPATTTDDLDSLFDDLDAGDVAAGAAVAATAGASVAASSSEEEIVVEDENLESDIAHDLEADLDSELDALLSSNDDIELDELSAEEENVSEDEDFDELAGLNLLEGADEVETKLDLARAYLDMEDLEGAKDILEEIVSEGSEKQKTEAQALIQSINEK
jgi:pilus assembly protein FimV